ncbi:MAG: DUF2779 domain-containing protein [Chitinophagales bacterium]|nr:DUF2779 domain-containing protein [Chitinophagales bacterium]
MANKRSYITKSGYLLGVKCELAFHNWWNKVEAEYSEGAEAVMQAGTDIGKLAHSLVSDGIDMNLFPDQSPWKLADKTLELLNKHRVIFEATFLTKQNPKLLCKVDILIPDGKGWMIWEVKATNSVKDEHLEDLAFQYYVLSALGLKITRAAIVHLNKEYIKNGALDIKQLFTISDQTQVVKNLQDSIQQNIFELVATGKLEKVPVIPIGSHCSTPYDCPYLYICWKDFPEQDTIYTIPRIGAKADIYLKKGMFNLSDIDPNILSENQKKIYDAHIANTEIIDKPEIQSFINGLQFPIHFLDFETIMPALPIWDGTHTYQQIPFQYSLHIVQKKGDAPQHFEFLDTALGNDPRIQFIEQLLDDLQSSGTILVYNKSFEEARLKEIAIAFPKYENAIIKVINRIQDLWIPFRNFWFYHPDMQGSSSIKKVLPVLVPELSYANLEIGEGGAAMNAFLQLLQTDISKNEKEKVLNDLKEYCKLDTLAMVKILEKLQDIISK